MIEVEEVDLEAKEGLKRKIKFYLIDSHHHIGEDEDKEHKNLNFFKSFDFFRNIWKQLNEKYNRFEQNNSYPPYFKPKFKIKKIFPASPLKFNDNIRQRNSWIFDQFIAFPFNDTFRSKARKDGKIVQYHSSNTRLTRLISDSNSGFRLIGYCRLDPKDGKLAIEELDYCIKKLRLKGIKLHPLSDDWNEEDYFSQNSKWVNKILKRAIKYNIPVIFDCRFRSTLKWIYKLSQNIYKEFINNNFKKSYLNSRLKVIIAHIGFLQQQDDNLLYEALSHPCIYGDLTGQFSSKTKRLIENIKEKVKYPFEEGTKFDRKYYWSKKIVLGSDYNYFEAFHIVDQLLYLFSQDFYNLIGGNLSVIQNILSRNIIRLLPHDLKDSSLHDNEKKRRVSTQPHLLSKAKFQIFMKNLVNFIDQKFSKEELQKGTVYFRYFNNIDYFNLDSRLDSILSSNFKKQKSTLESQKNFYFIWNNLNFALIGIIPDRLDRIAFQLISDFNLEDSIFQKLKELDMVTINQLGEKPEDWIKNIMEKTILTEGGN
jgi:predicted TIM-barrel fold metal-dependent hydrolase